MSDLPVIPLPGSSGWRDAYQWGDLLEERFPGQDGAELAYAIEYNAGPPLGPLNGVIDNLEMLQKGEHDGDDWRWRITLTDGTTLIAEGGCDFTGWDCRSDLRWSTEP